MKIYPVIPNYTEMMQLLRNSSVTPKHIVHLLRDDDSQIYLASCIFCDSEDDKREGEFVTSAAAQIRFATRWITLFEIGLVEQKVWSVLSGCGYGNTYKYIRNHFSDIPEIKQLP